MNTLFIGLVATLVLALGWPSASAASKRLPGSPRAGIGPSRRRPSVARYNESQASKAKTSSPPPAKDGSDESTRSQPRPATEPGTCPVAHEDTAAASAGAVLMATVGVRTAVIPCGEMQLCPGRQVDG